MNRSYRLGIAVVLGTVVMAAAVCLALVRRYPAPARAALDLTRDPLPLGTFQLVERSGRTVTERDLADRVWVAAFVFTRCPSSCPRISAIMKGLQAQLAPTGVRLVSISVDPTHDQPDVLRDYAKRFYADRERWWFLTGPKDEVYRVILDRFKVPVAESSAADREAGAEAVSHSARLALVDRGNNVVGYFDSSDPDEVARLVKQARRLDRAWLARLPAVNATLNASAGLLLLVGLVLIRARRVRAHAACMVSCLVVSALFLGCYLVYHEQVGSVPFAGVGPIRHVYFTVLLSHTVLAVATVPLVGATVWKAARRRFTEHARLARFTFPIWLYVSVTGVVVYLMLYQMNLPANSF